MRVLCSFVGLAILAGSVTVCGCGPSGIEAPPTEGLGPPDVSKLGGGVESYKPGSKSKSKSKRQPGRGASPQQSR